MLTVKKFTFKKANPDDLDVKIIIYIFGVPIYIQYQYSDKSNFFSK